MRVLAAVALFAAVVTSAGAQNFAAGGAAPTMGGWGRAGGTAAGFHRPFGREFRSFSAFYLGDAGLASYPVPGPATPIVILQSAPAATQPVEEPKPADPLLIEWQGDHYARISGASSPVSRQVSVPLDYSESAATSQARPQNLSCGGGNQPGCHTPQPAAVLVFRDGHREQVAEYSIVGGAIYTAGDFWKSGAWTRKIPLSDLDLPATVEASRAAGVKFALPSGPNVVIASF